MEYTIYEQLKWWLPIISFFGVVVKAYLSAKKSVGEWASALLDNHLHSIESATKATVEETQMTNKLLADHNDKEMRVWDSVTKTLVVLEDRTRTVRQTPRRR